MSHLSTTDFAIRKAHARGTLRAEERYNARLDALYVAICDENGIIEVAEDRDAAEDRVTRCLQP